MNAEIESAARRLCRHKIVFTGYSDIQVVALAVRGISTRAIAATLGITPSQAQYRIKKAQDSVGKRFRWDYRNGLGGLAQEMLRATESIGRKYVERNIAPKFIPLAASGVPRR